jgi:DTW domain-containing protein
MWRSPDAIAVTIAHVRVVRHASFDPRCPTCFMKPALCLCGVFRRRPIRSHVRVVAPDTELQKSTNTGRLLPLLLEHSEIVIHGGPHHPSVSARLWPEGTRPVVLFPLEGAPTIDAFVDATRPPVCLIVLDGTWRQANRLRKRFLVERVPFARLPDDDHQSLYALRHGHFEGSRSTLEAAARALAILEGDESVFDHLIDGFRRMVDRTLWLRGELSPDDVYGGLPPGVERHDINTREREKAATTTPTGDG